MLISEVIFLNSPHQAFGTFWCQITFSQTISSFCLVVSPGQEQFQVVSLHVVVIFLRLRKVNGMDMNCSVASDGLSSSLAPTNIYITQGHRNFNVHQAEMESIWPMGNLQDIAVLCEEFVTLIKLDRDLENCT